MIKPIVKTSIPGPKSLELIKRVKNSVALTGYVGLYGVVLAKGEGVIIWDVDGNSFLDFLGGASVVNIGYKREDMIKVIEDASRRIHHTCFPYSPNVESIKLAEKLQAITPGDFEKRVIFGLSGSDSNDAAIKAARKFTGKRKLIAFKNSYHGTTGLSLQANGFPGLRKGLFLEGDVVFVDFPNREEEGESILGEIEDILQREEICALITEPIQGDAGNIIPPPNFHQRLRDLVHKYGALYIVDEVQSGVGRSGKWWEIEHFGVAPDILTTAKSLTGGYAPLGACIGKKEIINSLAKAQHILTYSGHPIGCAVANKVLSIIEEEKLMENAQKMGELLKEELNKLWQETGCARKARGMGLHIGFEVVDKETNQPLGGLFGLRCVEKGVYPGYFGSNNNVLRLHPSLIINEEQMRFAIDVISSVVKEWDSGNFPKDTLQRYKEFGVGLGTD